jgi:hypothetical protein
MSESIREQIIEQVDRLDDPQRRLVLAFARGLTALAGTPGKDLMRFVGCIDAADLEAIAEAIQEGCEMIEANAW